MWFKWKVWLKNPKNTLWMTPAIGAVLGLLIAPIAYMIDRMYVGGNVPVVNVDLIKDLLSVISSSMLAVSTFSLSIMVSAYASASSGATPRATQLVMGDDNSRIAIASFISAFIFSLISQLTVGFDFLGNTGLFVVLISTVAMLAYIIFTLIRWIGALSQLGRLGNTLQKIRTTTESSVQKWRQNPHLGAHISSKPWEAGMAIHATQCAYLTHIDVESLQNWAQTHQAQIQLNVVPGVLVSPDVVVMTVQNVETMDDEAKEVLRSFLVLGSERVYEEDPRYGLIVLSEVALRAISPLGASDPGTAMQVFNHILSILVDAKKQDNVTQEVVYDRLHVIGFDERDLVSQPFEPIIATATADLNVMVRLLKILHKIHVNAPEVGVRLEAAKQAQQLLARAKQNLGWAHDVQVLETMYTSLFKK